MMSPPNDSWSLLTFRLGIFTIALVGLLLATFGLRLQPDRIALLSFEIARHYQRNNSELWAGAVAAARRRSGDCLSDIRRGTMAVALDRWQSDPSSEEAASAVREAATMRLSCAPTDGNAWLLMARAATMAMPSARVAEYVRASSQMAPAEGWIIELRLSFICRAKPELQFALKDLISIDASRLLLGKQYATFASLYDQCSEQSRTGFDKILVDSRPEVAAAYARAVAVSLE